MKHSISLLLLFLAVAAFSACGGDDESPPQPDEGASETAGDPEASGNDGHGARQEAGSATIGERSVTLALLGGMAAGQDIPLDVNVDGDPVVAVRAWVGVESGKGSMKAKLAVERGAYHGHILAPDALPDGSAIWIELEEEGGAKSRGSFAIPHPDQSHGHGGGHSHGAGIGRHHGIMAKLQGGAGHLELKLHDDKGDLELWLTTDAEGKSPLDLPLDTVVRVTMIDKDTTVELRVRNRDENEDEDGNPQVRDGKTNYFIFPGDSGADATWLQGKAFSAQATIELAIDGETVRSEEFRLVPHVH